MADNLTILDSTGTTKTLATTDLSNVHIPKHQLVLADGTAIGADTDGVLVFISKEHHEVHEGDAYKFCDITDVGNAASRNILLVTPNTATRVHIVFEVTTEAEAEMNLFEGPTYSVAGTTVDSYNRDRNSANTASLTVTHTPTTSADGTKIEAKHWGSGRDSGGEERGATEWVLKQNTAYLLRVTNATALANQTTICAHWYEES